MNEWKKIWEKKGTTPTSDLRWLDGFEDSPLNPYEIAKWIIKQLNIDKEDRVLEVGAGSGMIAQYISPFCHYVGIDYAKSLVDKHIHILGNSVLLSEANDIPFKDKYFDKSFAYSVFHYFPDREYVNQVISEMKRVTKNKIFLGDLPMKSRREDHLLFNTSDFDGCMFDMKVCNANRFNVKILL